MADEEAVIMAREQAKSLDELIRSGTIPPKPDYLNDHKRWTLWYDEHVRCVHRENGGRCYGMRIPGLDGCATHRDEAKRIEAPTTGVVKKARKPSDDDGPGVDHFAPARAAQAAATMPKRRRPSED